MNYLLKIAFFCLIFCGFVQVGFGQTDTIDVSQNDKQVQDTLDWEKTTVLEARKTSTGTISKIRNDKTGHIFTYTEEMPQFPGGLLPFLRQHMRYPKDAFKKRISGTVQMEFTITETGEVTDIRIIESVYESLDQEAIRVISLMPRWIPGKQNGKPVPVTYKFPFRFNLK